jgi:hypothetical protein
MSPPATGAGKSWRRSGYYKDATSLDRLKTDKDLKPLQQRPGYQKLLTSLESSSP